MSYLEAKQSFSADTTPVEITTTVPQASDYMLVIENPASTGGVTAYLTASATDAAANGLAIPPQTTIRSGPWEELPFLYAASTRSCNVQIISYTYYTGYDFDHTQIPRGEM